MLRTIHFWPHDLRPAPDLLVVPDFDERLVPDPGRTVLIIEQACLHSDRAPHGTTKSGNQRFRCKTCTRTFVEKPGNNLLKPAKAEALRAALLSGLSTRAAAKEAGVAHKTAVHYRKLWAIEANCACGQPAGHRGWCRERLRNSPARQRVIAELHGGLAADIIEDWAELAAAIKDGADDFGTDPQVLNAALVMVAALLVHFDPYRISALTAVPLANVEQFAERFRATGIWAGDTVCSDLDGETANGLGFWLDAMVGAGRIRCYGDSVANRQYGSAKGNCTQALDSEYIRA